LNNRTGWQKNCTMLLIPTARKEKLPSGFSYPLGAQVICDALDGIPQATNAKFWFGWRDEFWVSKWRERLAARGTITLLEVTYKEYFGYWSFHVYSVPSEDSVFARDHLLRELHRVRSELIAAGNKSRNYHATVKLNLSEAKRPAINLPEPTGVGTVNSAIAVHVPSRRRLGFR
jgi:hypothetical protein